MRILLSLILLALASCDPVYAQELTVITPSTEFIAPQPSSTPIDVAAKPADASALFDVDDYASCDYLPQYQTSLSLSSPLYMLAGADWSQTIQPMLNGYIQDYQINTFRVEFIPSKSIPVIVELVTIWTDTYYMGVLSSDWYTSPVTLHNGVQYGYFRPGIDQIWLTTENPYWRNNALDLFDGDGNNGHMTWRISSYYMVDSKDFKQGIPLVAIVTPTGGSLHISLSATQTAMLHSASGTLLVHINNATTGNSEGMVAIPIESYPMATEL